MAPEVISQLFADVMILKCVGPAVKEKLSNITGERVIDILYHLPVNLLDRRTMPSLTSAENQSYITSVVTVDKHMPGYARSRVPYKVRCSNDSGFLTLTFFNAKKDYISDKLPVGQRRVVSGKVEYFDGELQMPHPDYIVTESDLSAVQRLEPVYRLTQGLHLKTIAKAIAAALEIAPNLPEWIEKNYIVSKNWKSWRSCLDRVHNPEAEDDIEKKSNFYQRLAYDELLANQLALAIVREKFRDKRGKNTKGDGSLSNKLKLALPFELTKEQKDVLSDILGDMAGNSRMLRLLQGDVGSGKTVVSLLAMLNAVECNKQAALMAPTGILANQHYKWISAAINMAGLSEFVSVELFTGGDKAADRNRKIKALQEGKINIAIGTHALFQKGIEFKNLALVVIDEQHKFGVKQRLSMTEKGTGVDILLMTATPIPRTLTLTFYGDIEISSLKEKPASRKSIDTRAMPVSRIEEVVDGLGRVIEQGNRVYWICPLVEESGELDLTAVSQRYDYLHKRFGNSVAMVHGRMKVDEREKIMQEFIAGEKKLLVATTVIEVGVDVPDATVMVIEHAERFGLSQLHQLRGRVGRGERQSSCVLLYSKEIGKVARKRLQVIRETNDGFQIAEADLDLRGAGEVLGTRQSGMPDFKVADITLHRELLLAARDDAKLIMERDPTLQTERGKALRILLYLFEYDRQVKYLQSG